MTDPWTDPDFLAWAQDVKTNMVPKLEASAISMSLVPSGGVDVKYAVELGYSIMLDKPIILVVLPGTPLPHKLVTIADEIVEGDLDDDSTKERLMAAIQRVRASLGDDDD